METQLPNIRQNIRNTALGYLARREHSYKELLNKIVAKFSYSPDVIEVVLDELVESRLLDDNRFAEVYIRSRLNKGFGPERIAMELREKGVNQLIIREGLNNSEIDWRDVAFKVWKKKYKPSQGQRPPLNYSERVRQSAFLRYRGFRHGEIETIFDTGE